MKNAVLVKRTIIMSSSDSLADIEFLESGRNPIDQIYIAPDDMTLKYKDNTYNVEKNDLVILTDGIGYGCKNSIKPEVLIVKSTELANVVEQYNNFKFTRDEDDDCDYNAVD